MAEYFMYPPGQKPGPGPLNRRAKEQAVAWRGSSCRPKDTQERGHRTAQSGQSIVPLFAGARGVKAMASEGLNLSNVGELRVVDLKEELKTRGLATDGKKVSAIG